MESLVAEILDAGTDFSYPDAASVTRPNRFALKIKVRLFRVDRHDPIVANSAGPSQRRDPDRSILRFTNRAGLIVCQTVRNGEALHGHGLDLKEALVGAGPKIAFGILFKAVHAGGEPILRDNQFP